MVVHVVLHFDGEASLREVIDLVADVTGLDPVELAGTALATVRRLLTVGCLDLRP